MKFFFLFLRQRCFRALGCLLQWNFRVSHVSQNVTWAPPLALHRCLAAGIWTVSVLVLCCSHLIFHFSGVSISPPPPSLLPVITRAHLLPSSPLQKTWAIFGYYFFLLHFLSTHPPKNRAFLHHVVKKNEMSITLDDEKDVKMYQTIMKLIWLAFCWSQKVSLFRTSLVKK